MSKFFSIKSTDAPFSAASMAAEIPVMPAPTMTTSAVLCQRLGTSAAATAGNAAAPPAAAVLTKSRRENFLSDFMIVGPYVLLRFGWILLDGLAHHVVQF